MGHLHFTISALFITLFLITLFITKEKIKSIDNSIFVSMLSLSLIDCILMIIVVSIGYGLFGTDEIAKICNKLDFTVYIFWSSLLLAYIINAIKNKNWNIKKITNIIIIFDIVLTLIVFFLPINLYKDINVMYAYGKSVLFTYIICALYGLLILIIVFLNLKNIVIKKIYPLFVLVVLIVIALIAYRINPTVLIIPAIISYLNLIIYFTIENPDLKMLRQVELAKDKAEQSSRAKSDFLSSMSHEIRTPLNAIVGLSEDNLTYQDSIPFEVKENCNDIINASKSLLEIVGNILDINKLEANKMEIIEEKYNFKEEIENLAKIDALRIGDKNINFILNISKDIPDELIGDKIHVKEIVNNLLTNAIKYTEQGEIELNIECLNKNEICNLIISVRDTGKGIKEENIDKLFNKFERLDTEINSTIEGTGLGLAITKSLVELMNGKIEVHTELNKGSTFIVEIPQKINK